MLLLLYINSFIKNIFEFTNMNYILLWIVPLIILFILVGFERERHLHKVDMFQLIFIYTIIYLMFTYILGLLFGFIKNPYSMNAFNILKKLIPFLSILICQELLRYIVISKCKEKKIIIGIMIIIFFLFEITVGIKNYNLNEVSQLFEYITVLVIPSFIKELLLTYICYKSGYKATILYRIILESNVYFLPIFPELGVYLEAIFAILFPLFVFLKMNRFYEKTKLNSRKKDKVSNIFLWIPTVMIFASLVILTSGRFKIYSLAIGSGSMSPSINIGDVVIVQKLSKEEMPSIKKNDVIVYVHDKKLTIHRVTDIFYQNKELTYQTKGDNNNALDNYYLKENQIKGIVHFKVPTIGYPSVWLNRILSK